MIIFLLLILVFIIIEKWGTYREGFLNTEYDFFHNGNLYIDTRNKGDVNIGIGNDVDDRYAINVGGTMFIKDKLCYGNTCITEYLLSILNKIPVFFNDKLCLKASSGEEICVDEDRLKILTGEKTGKFKSTKTPENTRWKRPQYLHSVNTWSPGSNDDNDDTVGNSCKGHGSWCSEWSGRNHDGMNYGVGVDTINKNEDGKRYPKVGSFQNFLRDCTNRYYRWSEPDYAALDFYMIPKEKAQINWNRYPTVNNNFAPKPFSYKCYST